MSRSLIAFTILLSVFVLGCVQQEEITSVEELKDCQCHELAYKYPKHVNGTPYCLDCHEIEKHPDVDAVISADNCSECHESSLFRIHMPNYSCSVCHGDAKTIHEKFEKSFVEGTE